MEPEQFIWGINVRHRGYSKGTKKELKGNGMEEIGKQVIQ